MIFLLKVNAVPTLLACIINQDYFLFNLKSYIKLNFVLTEHCYRK